MSENPYQRSYDEGFADGVAATAAPCNDVEWEKAKRELNNRTIERCVQLVQHWLTAMNMLHDEKGEALLYKLRKLKEQP